VVDVHGRPVLAARAGIAPLVSGDRVLALARTSGGYVAVGKNLHPHGSDVLRTPVLWMSTTG
jgi:hypothetical protein